MTKYIFDEQKLYSMGYIWDYTKSYMFKSILRVKKSGIDLNAKRRGAILDIAPDGRANAIGDPELVAELMQELKDNLANVEDEDLVEMINYLKEKQKWN